jgi:hypothetical protein
VPKKPDDTVSAGWGGGSVEQQRMGVVVSMMAVPECDDVAIAGVAASGCTIGSVCFPGTAAPPVGSAVGKELLLLMVGCRE